MEVNFLQKKLSIASSLETATNKMVEFTDAFPNMHSLYAAALTIRVSTATCKNSFSTFTRILQPRRRSMTHERKAQLVLLDFEKKMAGNLDFDRFVTEFNTSSRHIVLRHG